MKITVSKRGTVIFGDGTYYLDQNRRIFVINRLPLKHMIAGTFQFAIPEKFDLWGGDAKSRKIVTELLRRAREIVKKSELKAKKKAKKKTKGAK